VTRYLASLPSHHIDITLATHTHLTRAGTHNWSQLGALPHITQYIHSTRPRPSNWFRRNLGAKKNPAEPKPCGVKSYLVLAVLTLIIHIKECLLCLLVPSKVCRGIAMLRCRHLTAFFCRVKPCFQVFPEIITLCPSAWLTFRLDFLDLYNQVLHFVVAILLNTIPPRPDYLIQAWIVST